MNTIITTPGNISTGRSIKKQQGLTLISWIVVLVFLLFQGVIAMNVLPVYITDRSVASIMQELPQDPKLHDLSPRDLKIAVSKRLNINSVYDVNAEHITVKKARGFNLVTIEYEPRGTLIGNLDYIVSFIHEAKVASR